jgi:glycosyltransferase involved in cell wall biosynthesis
MKVSILINNHNYAPFVGGAIESALAQDHRDCEVIVVDDGSTDDSWRVITTYGDRIRAVRQENGGQGAAYNTLWSMAGGEFVLFLDADDRLDPDAISTCLRAADDDTASVQFRLRLIDEAGAILLGAIPYLMHDGYVTPMLRRFVHYAGPPGSGNFYRARAIARAFPLDVPYWRRGADTIPFIAAAFAGRVTAIRRELGAYRLHHPAHRKAGIFGNIDATYRATLVAAERRRLGSLAMLRRGYGISLPGPFLPPPTVVRARALSWRLDPKNHPYHDTRAGLLRLQLATLRHWPGFGRIERLTLITWMVLVVTLPATWVTRLAASNTSGAIKAWIRRRFGGAAPSTSQSTQSSGASS